MHIYICIYLHILIYIHVHILRYVHARAYNYLYARRPQYISTYMYLLIFLSIYIYLYTYAYVTFPMNCPRQLMDEIEYRILIDHDWYFAWAVAIRVVVSSSVALNFLSVYELAFAASLSYGFARVCGNYFLELTPPLPFGLWSPIGLHVFST